MRSETFHAERGFENRVRVLFSFLVVLILACGLAGRSPVARAQESPVPSASAIGDVASDVDAIVAMVKNASLQLDQRVFAFGDLLGLPVGQRVEGLRTLALTADPAFAATAARELMLNYQEDIAALVGRKLLAWDASSQQAVLQAVLLRAAEESHAALARIFLQDLVATGNRGKHGSSIADPIDLAALILAVSAIDIDRKLIARCLEIHPRSRGLWLALAQGGPLSTDELALATHISGDPALPDLVRAAAAVTAANQSEAAMEFFLERIDRYLNRFRDMEQWALIEALREGKEEYLDFRENIRLVAMLRFLDERTAKSYTLKLLGVKNEGIRSVAALVRAVRWPERVIELGGNKLSEEQYAEVLGVTVLYHPNLIDRIPAAVRVETLRRAERLRLVGFGGSNFGLAGSAACGL